ncbi:MAG: helix-turn-helix transcriptional regulator [Spirochaetes bacterium]|nr:helix-turn-helix transcriptional regulator [Spirochaetota bacterium]
MMLDPFLKSQPARYRHELPSCEASYWIFVREGRLHLETPGGRWAAGGGMGVVLPKGSKATLWTGERRGYRGVSLTVLGETGAPDRARILPLSEELRMLVDLLHSALSRPGERSVVYLRHLASALLLAARGRTEDSSEGDAPSYAQHVVSRMEGALTASVYGGQDLGPLLGGLGLSPRQCARLFEARHGCSPKAWQLRLKLADAKRWLSDPDTHVGTVAAELGFASPQHFAAFFRRQTGQTPRAWRSNPDRPEGARSKQGGARPGGVSAGEPPHT